MGSTIRTATTPSPSQQLTAGSLIWQSWPLADRRAWSWLVPLSVMAIGGFVFWSDGGWLLALAASAAVAVSLRQFLFPVKFEVTPLGVRRQSLGRVRLVPWQAVRAYRMRPTGVVFFQRPDPTAIDVLRALFVPYPHDEDELLIAIRLYLQHAVELP